MYTVDEKLSTRIFRLNSHNQHKQRLFEISVNLSKCVDNSTPNALQFRNLQRTGFISKSVKKQKTINTANEKLYTKISKISSGKGPSFIHNLFESKSPNQNKSLNASFRKKETQRIKQDNEFLAKRLNKSCKSISFHKFDEDWLNSTRYKESISKKNMRKFPNLKRYSRFLHSNLSTTSKDNKTEHSKSPIDREEKYNQLRFSAGIGTPLKNRKLEEDRAEIDDFFSKKQDFQHLFLDIRKIERKSVEGKKITKEKSTKSPENFLKKPTQDDDLYIWLNKKFSKSPI